MTTVSALPQVLIQRLSANAVRPRKICLWHTEVRRSLQPLVDLAAEQGCALIGITHYSKGTAGRDRLERVTGSLAFGALPRIVLGTAKPAEEGAAGDWSARSQTSARSVAASSTNSTASNGFGGLQRCSPTPTEARPSPTCLSEYGRGVLASLPKEQLTTARDLVEVTGRFSSGTS